MDRGTGAGALPWLNNRLLICALENWCSLLQMQRWPSMNIINHGIEITLPVNPFARTMIWKVCPALPLLCLTRRVFVSLPLWSAQGISTLSPSPDLCRVLCFCLSPHWGNLSGISIGWSKQPWSTVVNVKVIKFIANNLMPTCWSPCRQGGYLFTRKRSRCLSHTVSPTHGFSAVRGL